MGEHVLIVGRILGIALVPLRRSSAPCTVPLAGVRPDTSLLDMPHISLTGSMRVRHVFAAASQLLLARPVLWLQRLGEGRRLKRRLVLQHRQVSGVVTRRVGGVYMLNKLRFARTPLLLVLKLVGRLRLRVEVEVVLLVGFIQLLYEFYLLFLAKSAVICVVR